MGNASAQLSQTQRTKVLKALNPDLQDLVDEDDLFREASPNLFVEGFEKQMKERAGSVKLVSKARSTTNKSQFFHKGRSAAPPRGSKCSRRHVIREDKISSKEVDCLPAKK